MNQTVLYCIKGETEKYKKSIEWYKENIRKYPITEDDNVEYYKAVDNVQYECYAYADYMEHFDITKLIGNYYRPKHYIEPVVLYSMKNDLPSLIRYIENSGNNYLFDGFRIACYCGYVDMVKWFISNILKSDWDYELHYLYDNTINCGDDTNPYDPTRMNDITLAVINNNYTIFKLLFDNFYDININPVIFLDKIRRKIELREWIEIIFNMAFENDNSDIVKYTFNKILEYAKINPFMNIHDRKIDVYKGYINIMKIYFDKACINKKYKCIKYLAPLFNKHIDCIRTDFDISVWFILIKYIKSYESLDEDIHTNKKLFTSLGILHEYNLSLYDKKLII